MSHVYLLLFSLYWAQGLPVGFMTHALPVILRAQGVSLTHIGGFGLLMAPWALKVLWAPWVDRYGSSAFGHYRSWIIPTQIFTVAILIILSFLPIQALNQPVYLLAFFIALLFMNTVGATQDIATDGLAVSILKGEQQHIGNMFQVVGSRLGFIVGGGAILWALDWLNWQSTFLILAGLVALNTIPIFLYREPKHHGFKTDHSSKELAPLGASTSIESIQKDQLSFFKSLMQYLQYFMHSQLMLSWFVVLCVLKITDGLSGPIIKPLLVDLGLTLSEIGVYITMLGAFAALIGAGLAGLSLKYVSRSNALILFSILKLLSLLGFTWLAYLHAHHLHIATWWIYLINALEDMFASMLLVIILTLVMQYSRKEHAGTDFTFQVSLMAMVSGVLYTVSGIAGDALGYQKYLMSISVIGLILIMPIWYWKNQSLKAHTD
ncbi:MFS transporter [Acinetobacter shaoyimingii]|uniref:MFS transporter n=1 Tax=Acinetobacter shaoyimingii TaxID=2715164 RepID=A0A6G8RZZ4_9GAMM|nr:MFS transporter [Acinetobacter shaoyimingii]QIO07522.1 MFS transporter [Acinetobacter shaoyimingii]